MGIDDREPSKSDFNQSASQFSSESTSLNAEREAAAKEVARQAERWKNEPSQVFQEAKENITSSARRQSNQQSQGSAPSFDFNPPGYRAGRNTGSSHEEDRNELPNNREDAARWIKEKARSYRDLSKEQSRDDRSRGDDDGGRGR